jgi:membrane protease YdiL (CAAX protease family)
LRSPGLLGGIYLFYLLAFMPWMAFRTKRRMTPDPDAAAPAPLPTRTRIFASTILSLALLFFVSWQTGSTFEFAPFAGPPFALRDALAAAAALAAMFALMLANRAIRSPEERRKMTVYRLLPRAPAEWALYVVMAIGAGIAEEVAYRGVLFAILGWTLGSVPAAAAVSAAAFAVSHAMQGWKTGVIIFAMALLFQALVWFTGTLVVAMIVHATYDLIAGVVGSRRIARGEVEG